jgi:uncharacterized protein (TIGR00725 family)
MKGKVRIGVLGSDGSISEELAHMAEMVGRNIAIADAILICGGRGGVMEAACRGAKEAGGTTVGILPFMDKESANPYVDIPVTTSYGLARNTLVASSSDAVIAIHGSVGTLSEIALAMNYGRPAVCVSGSGGMADHMWDSIEKWDKTLDIPHVPAGDAVRVALELIDRKKGDIDYLEESKSR